jgi:hypothetical protein
MYSRLAEQDDTLPVHVFGGGEAWLDAEVAALREHVENDGPGKWSLCAKRVSAVFGSLGRTSDACASYYHARDFVAGAAGEAVQVKKTTAMRKARRQRRHRIARDPPHFVRRRLRPHEIAC